MLVGALAGVVSTMLGVGGGLVMVPLFALLGIMSVKRAAGTSLAVIVAVIAVGLATQLLRAPQDVHWPAAGLLVGGSFAGTFAGKWLHGKLPERWFRYAFSAVLLIVAARMLGVLPETQPLIADTLDAGNAGHIAFLFAAGLLAGVVAALFGLGGGVVAVPLLALGFGFFHDQFTAARATSLAMILPTAIIGAALHWKAGNVDRKIALAVTPVATVAAVAGVQVAYLVPQSALMAMFAVLLMAAALRLASREKVSPKVGERVVP